MLTNQDLYDKACNSLRMYGNSYGSSKDRGWFWCNPKNPSERCAIAEFIEGNNDQDIMLNLKLQMKSANIHVNHLVLDLTATFDLYPEMCNNKTDLEQRLRYIAEIHNLKYKDSEQSVFEELIQEAQDMSMYELETK